MRRKVKFSSEPGTPGTWGTGHRVGRGRAQVRSRTEELRAGRGSSGFTSPLKLTSAEHCHSPPPCMASSAQPPPWAPPQRQLLTPGICKAGFRPPHNLWRPPQNANARALVQALLRLLRW